MLTSLAVKGFKSLIDTGPIPFAPLTVLFGPNGAGKSNVLEALRVLSHAASAYDDRSLLPADLRARPLELFSFPPGGLPELLQRPQVRCEIEALIAATRYSLTLTCRPQSLQVERAESPEPGPDQGDVVLAFGGWRSYYLEPRVAMRTEQSARAEDIGPLGETLLGYLHLVKNERREEWNTIQRTLRVLVPAVERIDVEVDTRHGTLVLDSVHNGVAYSSRQVSEGTLRALGLVAALTNPGSTLVAFEEPENGVHPRRIEAIARLLVAATIEAREAKQVVVSSHSPILCGALVRQAREHPGKIALLRVVQGAAGTRVKPLDIAHPAFGDAELRQQLSTVDDASVFEGLVMRGLLDD